ncbi:hypothetical protein [Peribacillus sp. FSL R5-0717]|uniref:hypothetical protein n=1 Tax=Peribacillus sp. FSL R5-0717 TaxID=2975308 RepID=UPI0030F52AF5
MTISYGQEVFTLAAGRTFNFSTVFGGNTDTGGAYKGPMVVAGIAQTPNRTLTPATVGILFKVPGEYTTKCVYSSSITNNNSDSVSFKIHFFHD